MSRGRRTIPLQSQPAEPICPLAPSAHASVYAKSFHKACLILGGMEELSKKLNVRHDLLERWIRDEEEPPMSVFMEVVEILLLYIATAGRAA